MALAEGQRPTTVEATGIHRNTGDFFNLDHHVAIRDVVNKQAQTYFDILSMPENVPLVEARVKLLTDNISAFRKMVGDASNYAPGAADNIKSRYIKADFGKDRHDHLARAKARLATSPGSPKLVSDMDGTISLVTEPPDLLIRYLPGSQIAEDIMKQEQSRDRFPELFVKVWQPLLTHAPGLFEAAADYVAIREGVDELIKTLDVGDMLVLSANFEPFVKSILSRIEGADKVDVVAIRPDSLIPTDKGTVIQHVAKSDPDRPVIYIGDGSSDKPTIENGASDFVAVYFALEGSPFAADLEVAGAPYFIYRDFNDIRNTLSLLTSEDVPAQVPVFETRLQYA